MAPAVSRISIAALRFDDARRRIPGMSRSTKPVPPIVPLPLIVTFSLIGCVALVPGRRYPVGTSDL